MISFGLKGTAAALVLLASKRSKVTQHAEEGLKRAAIFMQGEVKESIAGRRAEHASVDTGRFLNSIEVLIGKVDATIFTQVPYANFLEFGTTRFAARRHFRNSSDRNKEKVQDIIQKEVKKA